jgi:hypothetical protein
VSDRLVSVRIGFLPAAAVGPTPEAAFVQPGQRGGHG